MKRGVSSSVVVFGAGIVAFVVACVPTSAPVAAVEAAASAPAPTSSAAPPVSAASAAASSPVPAAGSCLMVNVCLCNLGCARVDVPEARLRAGLLVTPAAGPMPGEKLKVVEMADTTGAKVLALTDLHHDHACSLPPARALLGYACEREKSGPIPAKACAPQGCD